MVAMMGTCNLREAQYGIIRWNEHRGCTHKWIYANYETMDIVMRITAQVGNLAVDHQFDSLPLIGRCSKVRTCNAEFHAARTVTHIVPSSTLEAFNENPLIANKRHLD